MKTLLTRALHNASDEKTRRPALIAKAPSEERPAPRPVAARRDQAARGVVAASVSETPFAQRARRTAGEAPRRSPKSREQVHSADAREEAAPRIVSTPPIQIARVRSVSVVPRSRGVDAQSGAALSEVRTADARAARVQSLTANDADTGGLRTKSSTLDRQAERLALGQLALAATRWTPPAHTPQAERPLHAAESPKAGFAVQVGAYSSESEARRQLQIAQMRAASLLDGRSALTQRIENSGKQYYRARFSGFNSHDAASACSQLKRQQIDCLVAKME